MSGLFRRGEFTLNSGLKSRWKVECNDPEFPGGLPPLAEADWETLALMASEFLPPFNRVIGIPTGGTLFAEALRTYSDPKVSTILFADDVLTTGGSMLRVMQPGDVGVVAFARGPLPPGIMAVWQRPYLPPAYLLDLTGGKIPKIISG